MKILAVLLVSFSLLSCASRNFNSSSETKKEFIVRDAFVSDRAYNQAEREFISKFKWDFKNSVTNEDEFKKVLLRKQGYCEKHEGVSKGGGAFTDGRRSSGGGVWVGSGVAGPVDVEAYFSSATYHSQVKLSYVLFSSRSFNKSLYVPFVTYIDPEAYKAGHETLGLLGPDIPPPNTSVVFRYFSPTNEVLIVIANGGVPKTLSASDDVIQDDAYSLSLGTPSWSAKKGEKIGFDDVRLWVRCKLNK